MVCPSFRAAISNSIQSVCPALLRFFTLASDYTNKSGYTYSFDSCLLRSIAFDGGYAIILHNLGTTRPLRLPNRLTC